MRKKLFYDREDLKDFSSEEPGEYPFLRGIHPTMYNVAQGGRLWTMRQFAGFGSAEQTNDRFHKLLAMGQTGLSTAFDLPTLMGLDSDNTWARGEVGKVGVAIDTLADMDKLFRGINVGEVSTSMTINGPAIVLLSMYFEIARARGVDVRQLRGTAQNDPFKEFIAQKEWIVPPAPSLKLLVDTIEYCTRNVPQWNPISISGYHIREAGADGVQEVAFTLADGIAYVEACVARGMNVDEFAPRLSFFLDFCNDWLEEVAKIRAARKLWARIMKERFGAKNPRSLLFRVHIQTAGQTLTQEQPLNNIVRTALQAFGAVLAGAQSLHTNSFDEQLSLPSEEAVTVALRTQQIIAHETGIAEVVDALGGSYAIEALTSKIEQEAEDLIRRIDDMGGMLSVIERGWPQREIASTSAEYQRKVEASDIIVVGQNLFREGVAPKPLFHISSNVQEEQIAFLDQIKKKRSGATVKRALKEIERAARANENCMYSICEAVKVYATEQEICDVLKSVFGEYIEPINI